MGIVTVSPASRRDLTTLAAIKREFGLAETGEDLFLADLIAQASSAVETECRRRLAREGVIETVLGRGRALLMLSLTPVVAVDSVRIGEVELASTEWKLISPEAGLLHRRDGWEKCPIEIAYTGGFGLPDDPDRSLPPVIERACIETVKAWYAGRDRDPSLAGESAGGYHASYTAARGVPETARDLLAPWRRPSFA
jgi:hypothetical protein